MTGANHWLVTSFTSELGSSHSAHPSEEAARQKARALADQGDLEIQIWTLSFNVERVASFVPVTATGAPS